MAGCSRKRKAAPKIPHQGSNGACADHGETMLDSLELPPSSPARRRGRPRKPAHLRRLERVVVRLNSREATYVADVAWRRGISEAQLMRAALAALMAGKLARPAA